jgi:hypothetical protein
MPASVLLAAPTTVMPNSLFKAFAQSREYLLVVNDYKNGESQRNLLVATSRRSWTQAKRLPMTQLISLRNFHDARRGPMEPFYIYDPFETVPKFSYDPTGVILTGRYTVRFDSPWTQATTMPRTDVPLTLIQLA